MFKLFKFLFIPALIFTTISSETFTADTQEGIINPSYLSRAPIRPLDFVIHIPSVCSNLFNGHYLSLDKFNLFADPSNPDIECKWRVVWREFSAFGIVKLSMALSTTNELEIRRVVPSVPHNAIPPEVVFPTEGLFWEEKTINTEPHCLLTITSTEMIVSLCDLSRFPPSRIEPGSSSPFWPFRFLLALLMWETTIFPILLSDQSTEFTLKQNF